MDQGHSSMMVVWTTQPQTTTIMIKGVRKTCLERKKVLGVCDAIMDFLFFSLLWILESKKRLVEEHPTTNASLYLVRFLLPCPCHIMLFANSSIHSSIHPIHPLMPSIPPNGGGAGDYDDAMIMLDSTSFSSSPPPRRRRRTATRPVIHGSTPSVNPVRSSASPRG
jgi:hypothetical protein